MLIADWGMRFAQTVCEPRKNAFARFVRLATSARLVNELCLANEPFARLGVGRSTTVQYPVL